MRRLVPLLLLLGLGSALAPGALAAPVSAIDLDRTGRSPVVRPFALVGIHWQGSGRVLFRTRSVGGEWSPWRLAAPEDGHGPAAGSREARARAGWRIGSPWWAGPSDRVETRVAGSVRRVRAYLVRSAGGAAPSRAPASADEPAIVLRSAWGANESIRRAPPTYASAVRFAIVHHTAGGNDYSRAEAPAVVRAIQLYHVQGNGWNDIGYNFLVDRFGTVYEGRFGGIARNVVGAHAQGFNTGSVGVALVGAFEGAAPPRVAQDALARLLAWRLDLAHVDPTSRLSFVSGGSDRHAAGTTVSLDAVSGHRDTGRTACPGAALYGRLGALAEAARAIGLPKIFDPRVEASDVATVRFRASISATVPWSVVVTDPSGLEVARGAGVGSTLDWTWDAASAAPGTYRWIIRAGAARPASGVVKAGTAAPLAVRSAVVAPSSISPNGDGQADTGLLAYELSAAANVTVSVADASGQAVATVVDRVWTRAGRHSIELDPSALTDGEYSATVLARGATGVEAGGTAVFTVSRTLGLVEVDPVVFSPNGDGRLDRLTISFALTVPADVRVRILRDGRWVASPLSASFLPGVHEVVWDGRRSDGTLRDASFVASVEASDDLTSASYAATFAIDTRAPLVAILPGRPLRVRVSEPALLTLRIDGAIRTRAVTRAGVVRIPWSGPARRVRVVARDTAGNASAPVVRVADPGQ